MVRAALLVLLVSLVGCGRQATPGDLADIALNESVPVAEREKAVTELVSRGPEVLVLVRKVAAESKTPSVRAAAFQPLGLCRDLDSAPMLLAACEDPDPLVRGRAGAALVPILSQNFHFKAEDPLPVRKVKIRNMRKSYEGLLLKPEIKKQREQSIQ
jgi:HEAT repeat protein